MSRVTREGTRGERPGREAVTAAQGVRVQIAGGRGRNRGGEVPVVGEATFRSYYGEPIINKPVWKSLDIAGYLFLGGLAGASSVVAAGAHATGRPTLARSSKVVSTLAAALSGLALVHDLGRPARFLNMLRVFKPTSPMSVGSWLLISYAPMSTVASFSAVTGRLPRVGAAGTVGAALLGPFVATYTAALISDTAVPAWHEGYRDMPLVFASSAASAASGWGMMTAPVGEAAPVRRLAVVAGLGEVGLMHLMKRRMGAAAGAYGESDEARRFEGAATALTVSAAALAATLGRRSRVAAAAAGAAMLAGSALTRFAIFEAGIASAVNPAYTVVPQRERLADRE